MADNRHTIRNLDKDLIVEARIYALQTGQSLGEVMNSTMDFFFANIDDTVDYEIDVDACV